jgi:hypothetical protein
MVAQPASNPDDSISGDVTSASLCPLCGKVYRPGELVCPNCGLAFSPIGKTRLIELSDIAPNPVNRRLYAGLLTGPKPITFEIEGQRITLPLTEQIIVGRCSGNSEGVQPDVDLSPFAAEEKGVSRCHVRIVHKGALVYVGDLGSLNGSWINGFGLPPQNERLLRDGDRLRLGKLEIKVTF